MKDVLEILGVVAIVIVVLSCLLITVMAIFGLEDDDRWDGPY